MNYKKQYKKELEEYFIKENIFFNEDIIKSILNKVAINSRNKYGCVDFEEEILESGIENGKIFYKEYKEKYTYNRTIKTK